MIDPYFAIQHLSLKDAEALMAAHRDVQELVDTEPPAPSSAETIPAPTSPTVPARKVA